MSNLAGLPPLGQKSPPLVSTALRQSASGEQCTLRLGCCNHNPETTVLAHLRLFSMAGMGAKPPDWCAVFACSACHDALDGRSHEPWGWDDVARALIFTLRRQFDKGLLEVAK